MTLLFPQALLLLAPLALFWWWRGRPGGVATVARGLLLVTLVLALAQPEWRRKDAGEDVVVLVDRSRSMPAGSEGSAEEVVRLLLAQRRPGDRLGVIGFGRDARLERPLGESGGFGGFTAAIDDEASNLSAALDAAGAMVHPERAGHVLIISDGRATGPDARLAARRLAASGVIVDARWQSRPAVGLDVAVTGLEAPSSVAAGEPLLLTATVKASAPTTATLVLARDGKALLRATRQLEAGYNVFTLPDLVEAQGFASYRLRVEAPGDEVPENDVGRAVLRVEGPSRVLLLTRQPDGVLARALEAAKLRLEVRAPFALSLEALEGVDAVVLEDVEAGALGESGLHALARFVRDAGGGLVMTGGRHAFGAGGYLRSPVDEVLPVSLELRREQRKASIAMAIVLDSSCSMGARVADGRTKMELAAEGVVAALTLLDEGDEASVHMVDTRPKEIFSMRPVSDDLPLMKVASGFSGGGGIYVGVALAEAKRQVLSSTKQTRHVVLFSDAADSEEPGDWRDTLDALKAEGVTVSVIGMGSRADSDARLLEDIAAYGGGRIYFAEDVTSLPRVFSEEAIAVARSSFIDEATASTFAGDVTQLGRLPVASAPTVGGYNVTWLRPGASLALRTAGDEAAPLVAFWQKGAGRAAALTAVVEGKGAGAFTAWPGQRALLESLVRWVRRPDAGDGAVARASLSGDVAHITLDVESLQAAGARVTLLPSDARRQPIEVPMPWEAGDRASAEVTLPGSGVWHPVVRLGDAVYRAPPLALPWAPEFEPAVPEEGHALLRDVARAGGGVERLSLSGFFGEARQSEAPHALAPLLVALGIAFMLVDVFARRLGLRWQRRRRPQVVSATPAHVGAPMAMSPSSPVTPPGPTAATSPAPQAPEASSAPSAMDIARERARRRTGRKP